MPKPQPERLPRRDPLDVIILRELSSRFPGGLDLGEAALGKLVRKRREELRSQASRLLDVLPLCIGERIRLGDVAVMLLVRGWGSLEKYRLIQVRGCTVTQIERLNEGPLGKFGLMILITNIDRGARGCPMDLLFLRSVAPSLSVGDYVLRMSRQKRAA